MDPPLSRGRLHTSVGHRTLAGAVAVVAVDAGVLRAGHRQHRRRASLDAIARSRGSTLDTDEVDRVAWLYRRHMDREAAAVLPFAREALSDEQQAALSERMALRRSASR